MTKNTVGGNKSKKFARKHNQDGNRDKNLLLSTDPLERYAIVTKMLGNGMFYATTDTGLENIIGHIRNKFKGRSKHGNMVSNGSFVLIGLREWEQPNFKHADLIHIYSPSDFQLVENFHNISSLSSLLNPTFSSSNTDDILFQHDADCASSNALVSTAISSDISHNETSVSNKLTNTLYENEIDIDDI